MYSTPGPSIINHNDILSEFNTALKRKNPELQNKLPTFLNTETPKIIPRRRHDRRKKKNVFETGGTTTTTVGDTQQKSRITVTF